MWKKAWVILTLIVSMGAVYAAPNVTIFSPINDTIFNDTIAIAVSSNETIDTWNFSLDGGVNVTFTPNTTLVVSRGSHTLEVFANNSNGTGSASVSFTITYVSVQAIDERTGAGIAIAGKVKFSNGTEALTFTTDATGFFNVTGLGFDDYILQAGNTSPFSGYPFVREFPFTYGVLFENQTIRLAARDDCETVFVQFIDFDSGIGVDRPLVTFRKANETLHQATGDQAGRVSDCLIIGDTYEFDASKTNYNDLVVFDTVFSNFLEFFMQLLTTVSLDTVQVMVQSFPATTIVMPNGTLALGVFVFDELGGIEEIGVVIGSDELVLVDDSVPLTDNYKILQCNIIPVDGRGGLLSCPGFDLSEWDEPEIPVDFFYVRNGTKFHKVVVFRKDVVSRIPLGPFPVESSLVDIYDTPAGNPWQPKPPGPILKSVFYHLGLGDLAINVAGLMLSSTFGLSVAGVLGGTAGFFVLALSIMILVFINFLSWKTLALVILGFVVWGSRR